METIENLPKNLIHASTALYGVLYGGLREHRKVHYPTAIAASAFLGGVTLLRATGIDLRDKKTGEPVAAPGIENSILKLIEYMQGLCALERLGRDGGWLDSIPKENRPIKRMADLIGEYEPRFRGLLVQYAVTENLHSAVAAYTAVHLIKDAKEKDNLHIDIGKALAAASTVKAAKTVPPRLSAAVMSKRLKVGAGKSWWRFWG